MKSVWNYINNLNLDTERKNKLFLFLNTLISGLLGAFLWVPVHFFALRTIEWLICFVGYAAVFIGFFDGIIYLGNHSF